MPDALGVRLEATTECRARWATGPRWPAVRLRLPALPSATPPTAGCPPRERDAGRGGRPARTKKTPPLGWGTSCASWLSVIPFPASQDGL